MVRRCGCYGLADGRRWKPTSSDSKLIHEIAYDTPLQDQKAIQLVELTKEAIPSTFYDQVCVPLNSTLHLTIQSVMVWFNHILKAMLHNMPVDMADGTNSFKEICGLLKHTP